MLHIHTGHWYITIRISRNYSGLKVSSMAGRELFPICSGSSKTTACIKPKDLITYWHTHPKLIRLHIHMP